MFSKRTTIQRKLYGVIQLITGAVLVLTCSVFFTYEYISFRRAKIRELTAIGNILGSNSTAALAFDDKAAASEILEALKVDSRISAACIYDDKGKLFAIYPDEISPSLLPSQPKNTGFTFTEGALEGYVPVINETRQVGTIYLRYAIDALYNRLQIYALLALVIVLLASALTYFLYRKLRNGISRPIIALAETAHAIADRQDFSVRAEKKSEDEIGLFTDAFNQMLTRIQQQNTALGESADRLRGVLNSTLSAVIVIDDKGMIIDWNLRAEKIFGWVKNEAIGRDLADTIIPVSFRDAHRNGIDRFHLTGQGPVLDQVLELTALRKDGTEFPIEISISVLRNNGSVTFCGFVTDITERKKNEEQIQLFQQKLEQMVTDRTEQLEIANKELESFSYSVSHDLRSPLRSVHGYINILKEEYSDRFDDEGKRLLDIVIKNAQRMGQLIDDLLNFSRLGRKELLRSSIFMHDMVEAVVDECKRHENGRLIDITVKKLPPAYADHATIRQVWVNLVSNAIKYSKHKEQSVIEIGSTEDPHTTTYYVKDNGAGFDMKYYDKLFGVFQRLHANHEFEGTGVGLAIVHRIITRHGGRVWAEGKIKEGATFYFSIPASETGDERMGDNGRAR